MSTNFNNVKLGGKYIDKFILEILNDLVDSNTAF